MDSMITLDDLRHVKHRFGIPTSRRDVLLLWLKARGRYSARRTPAPSALPVTVVIPLAEKDAAVFPHVVASIRACLLHPLQGVVAVAPGSAVLEGLCRELGCRYVHEDSVLPIRRSDVSWDYHGMDRSGWIFQQFLKWSGGAVADCRHYLCIDADTILARPQTFEHGGRVVYNCCDDYHRPYMRAYEVLLGEPVRCRLSFTSHQMLFDVAKLSELKSAIEKRHGCPWYEAILRHLDPDQKSPHSDYETYGQYVYRRYRHEMALEYWQNKAFPRGQLNRKDELLARLGRRCKTVSFHHYTV
jgi:hypothetical protein